MFAAASAMTLLVVPAILAADTQRTFTKDIQPILQKYCLDCHDAESKKGGLDLSSLSSDLADSRTFERWVAVHDRVASGEMPPPKKARPSSAEQKRLQSALSNALTDADKLRAEQSGRAVMRRMNRYEYENSLRDLLGAPWLQIKDMLPEDGEAHRFNKVGEALDVSHVQMARYLAAADYALREVIATSMTPPKPEVVKHYARDQRYLARRMTYSVFNRSPERATFAIIDFKADVPVVEGKAPVTVGPDNPEMREREAFGVVAGAYEPIEPKFDNFRAPQSGHYKLRFNGFTFWAGPDSTNRWWRPSRTDISKGRRDEPVGIYAETPPRLIRKLGSFDLTPEPSVQELDVYLLKGETIQFDAARLFRSRPPNWHNPLAEKDGQPGVAFRWMEVEGPIFEAWPLNGHRLLFGNLPVKPLPGGGVDVTTENPKRDAEHLLRGFVAQACRRPLAETDFQRFLSVAHHAIDTGSPFAEAMIAAGSAVLCSPAFVTLEEKPGRLDDHALATRLSYFLWNSGPDKELRSLAVKGELHQNKVLRQQTERMLADPRSRRFVDAFLDYWLDLRKANATSPDAGLYPDYYLDDLLVESAVEETQLFFIELLRGDLPARNIVQSDFTMLNERLAQHYGLPPVQGVSLRRTPLPEDSPRGGLITQASVLKVTANGTTTSPVLRGAWIMERIIGQPPPPPPPSVPAVEPDIRGASTIREQLDKHRSQASCNACHAKIDPAGFALENFDILGGWRARYRALGEGERPPGFGKNGQPFEFHYAQPVDCSGELPDGRKFSDIRDLKRLLLEDERLIARNLVKQLTVHATGAAVRFGDRPEVERILDRASSSHYGVRTLVHELVQSELFRRK